MAIYVSNSRVEHDADFDRLVRQEDLILDVTEALTQALNDAGITRAELAQRLRRTPGYVSQVFGGGRNLTLRTVADIAAALSMRPILTLVADHEFTSDWVHWTRGACETPRWHPSDLEHSLSVSTDLTSMEDFDAAA